MIALVNEVQTTIFSKHDYIQYNNMFELLILVEDLNLLELLNMFDNYPSSNPCIGLEGICSCLDLDTSLSK